MSRAVLWKPLPDSYHLLASMIRGVPDFPLFITQRAFLQIERHLQSAPESELMGLLAGHVCECPRTRARYPVINSAIPLSEVSAENTGSQITAQWYDAVQRRLTAHSLAVLGWYRNAAGLGLRLLPDDIETHVTYFKDPWQTAMLVVPDETRPRGAFFMYENRVARSYCIPFHELLDEQVVADNRMERSCVTWQNYVADLPVEPVAPAEKEVIEATITAPRAIEAPKVEPPVTEPLEEFWDSIREPWASLWNGATRLGQRVTSSGSHRLPNKEAKAQPTVERRASPRSGDKHRSNGPDRPRHSLDSETRGGARVRPAISPRMPSRIGPVPTPSAEPIGKAAVALEPSSIVDATPEPGVDTAVEQLASTPVASPSAPEPLASAPVAPPPAPEQLASTPVASPPAPEPPATVSATREPIAPPAAPQALGTVSGIPDLSHEPASPATAVVAPRLTAERAHEPPVGVTSTSVEKGQAPPTPAAQAEPPSVSAPAALRRQLRVVSHAAAETKSEAPTVHVEKSSEPAKPAPPAYVPPARHEPPMWGPAAKIGSGALKQPLRPATRVAMPKRAHAAQPTQRRMGMTVVVAASMVLVAIMAVRSRATQPAQAASATASSASAANGAVAPPSVAPESLLTRYAVRTDSLEEAIAFYREAQGEFEQKLIGCPTLARAYDMSNQRFWVMSKARVDVEEMLDPAAVMNADMLSAEMQDITRDFVRSRCRR